MVEFYLGVLKFSGQNFLFLPFIRTILWPYNNENELFRVATDYKGENKEGCYDREVYL